MSDAAPVFPYAAALVAPLRAASERAGSLDYMQLWAGQAAGLAQSMPADQFTRNLAADVFKGSAFYTRHVTVSGYLSQRESRSFPRFFPDDGQYEKQRRMPHFTASLAARNAREQHAETV